MKNSVILICAVNLIFLSKVTLVELNREKRQKCLSQLTFPIKIKQHIKSCQKEVKKSVIQELFEKALKNNPFDIDEHQIEQILRSNKAAEIKPTTINHQEAHFNSSHQVPIPSQLIREHHNYFDENQLLNTHNYLDDNQIHSIASFDHDYKFYQQQDDDQPHIIYRYHNNPEIQLLKLDSIEPQFYAHNHHHGPEIEYRAFSHEITPTDDERDHANDKNKIIEARDELMNILAKSHKIIERAAGNKIFSNNEIKVPALSKKKRRSLLTWWGYSTKSSGKEEESFEVENSSEEEEETLSSTDKYLTGCLIQCIYEKNGAIDRLGYPTLDGIVDLYTAGSSEQPYFIYAMRAVNRCLKHVSRKFNVNRKKKPLKETACNIAFEVFDCVSDLVPDYFEL